jgi:hypothetical protein
VTVRVRAETNPPIFVTHQNRRCTVSIVTSDDVVVVDGAPDDVERFLVELIAAFHRPIVAAQRPQP